MNVVIIPRMSIIGRLSLATLLFPNFNLASQHRNLVSIKTMLITLARVISKDSSNIFSVSLSDSTSFSTYTVLSSLWLFMLSCDWLCVKRCYKVQKSYAHTLHISSLKVSTLSWVASLESALLGSIVFKQLMHLIVFSRMNHILNII